MDKNLWILATKIGIAVALLAALFATLNLYWQVLFDWSLELIPYIQEERDHDNDKKGW